MPKSRKDGRSGGYFKGPSHEEGGIKATVAQTGEIIEFEGGESVINKKAMHDPEIITVSGTKREIASAINSDKGYGVEFDEGAKLVRGQKLKKGGEVKTKDNHNQIYSEWRRLVNMSYSDLKKFYDSEEGKKAGLSSSEASKQGIDSGRESARWIMKMKRTRKENWTPSMWRWAKKQISFIKRMSGVDGPLYDKKGNKTRKHTSLLIWGHNPEVKNMEKGGETQDFKIGDFVKQYAKFGNASGYIYEKSTSGKTIKLKDEWGNEEKKWFTSSEFKKLQAHPNYESVNKKLNQLSGVKGASHSKNTYKETPDNLDQKIQGLKILASKKSGPQKKKIELLIKGLEVLKSRRNKKASGGYVVTETIVQETIPNPYEYKNGGYVFTPIETPLD